MRSDETISFIIMVFFFLVHLWKRFCWISRLRFLLEICLLIKSHIGAFSKSIFRSTPFLNSFRCANASLRKRKFVISIINR